MTQSCEFFKIIPAAWCKGKKCTAGGLLTGKKNRSVPFRESFRTIPGIIPNHSRKGMGRFCRPLRPFYKIIPFCNNK